jgi:aminoglycoside phosphotransferase (APT) family kinase protein
MTEESLNGESKHQIVRIGDSVHRPAHWWTRSVHHLLNYLESVNFIYSPRVRGFDEQGREILSFIEGESGKAGWQKIVPEKGLKRYARLLREYHDVISGYKPLADSEWAYSNGGLKEGEIMCHGDFGVWNIVWKGDHPVGILDWDFVVPAKPRYDFLYALEYAAPFRDDETCLKWHHFPEVPDRKQRIKIFADAYGLSNLDDIVHDVAQMQRRVGYYESVLAERGLQPQVDWVANGDLEEVERRARWTEMNRSLFE